MRMEEFLVGATEEEKEEVSIVEEEEVTSEEAEATDEEEFENIDVQKAVVESLAADKAELDERINALNAENAKLKIELEELASERDQLAKKVESLNAELFLQSSRISAVASIEAELAKVKAECEPMKEQLAKTGDILAANSETELSNKIALLDRNFELPDRFPGETREQVIEVIREARNQAEAEGRIRKAQVLESVLVANEPTGELSAKRNALEKFFNENQNILSGVVIAELERCGISYKNGEEYLLPAEIIKRTY